MKKRAAWTEKDLQFALNAIASGSSQHSVSKQFRIPRRTLRNHLKTGSKLRKLGRYPVLNELQENELTTRILRFAEIGMPVTIPMVKSYVYDFCDKNGIKHPFDRKQKTAGRFWVANYLKRHPEISKRKAQMMNPGRALKLNRPIVGDYFEKLRSVMEQNDFFNQPRRIFNMDEKGCRLTLHHQQNVLVGKGAKRVHMVAPEHAENVTIVACANAAGCAVPPMIIFKGKRNKPEYHDNLPPDTLVTMSEKGSITTQLFITWLYHFGKFKPHGKVLLIFDGASSHIDPRVVDVADEHEIICLCLPSNTTHELQPMGKAVFKSFEHFWDCEVLKYWRAHPERAITKGRFGLVCTPAYNQALSVNNIVSGFRATGIYPFDPNAVPDEAYGPSTVSFEEDPNVCANDALLDSSVTRRACTNDEPLDSSFYTARVAWDTASLTLPNGLPSESISPVLVQPQLNEITGEFENCTEPSTTTKEIPCTSTLNSSFTELMKTPKMAKKRSIRKKSLTYKATVFTSNFFSSEKCNKKSSYKMNNKKSKLPGELMKTKKSKLHVQKAKSSEASWYCAACNKDTFLSMRQCCQCHIWYHEECVGLESDDEDNFICMDCE